MHIEVQGFKKFIHIEVRCFKKFMHIEVLVLQKMCIVFIKFMHIEVLVLQKTCINSQSYACRNFCINDTKINNFFAFFLQIIYTVFAFLFRMGALRT